MTTTITTVSGATRALPEHIDPKDVIGLDGDGRVVVKLDWMDYGFGLTLCCDAFDKGCEDGVFCRACYGGKPDADEGNYLFPAKDGSMPGLDPITAPEERKTA